MPSDPPKSPCTIGGRLSHPFRRALLALVILAISRDLIFGILEHTDKSSSAFLKVLDSFIGTIFTVGQAFLCMSTAYLLQCQLSNMVNINPGEGLSPYLAVVFCINVIAYTCSYWLHPSCIALISLGSAISTIPVIQTLQLYAKVTTYGGPTAGRGTVLTQVMLHSEYWYIFSSHVAFVAESMSSQQSDGADMDRIWQHDLIDAMRHHQDVGVDDWTRLLIHSIYLNLIDELMHVSPTTASNGSDDASEDREGGSTHLDGSGGGGDLQIVNPLVKHRANHTRQG
eukprot:CAMPEP_0119025038 /NCGR_PEP_ID=MMETSP1176-20130426/33033_1 /TAXON_ID=265551 /ORGANISM="Synedropsis recta cf, Strain CCMP1620" /LENGTH=283 /DNA_ID=CAMNT_0006980483 /DNA_START=90 /DNA_END=941 /DNA_ORIENTATION=+